MKPATKTENDAIRQEVAKAARIEALLPFNLSGRGHEARVTLDRSLAAILRAVALPKVYISGFGANFYYPRRVFRRAARELSRKLGSSPFGFDNSQFQVYRLSAGGKQNDAGRPQ